MTKAGFIAPHPNSSCLVLIKLVNQTSWRFWFGAKQASVWKELSLTSIGNGCPVFVLTPEGLGEFACPRHPEKGPLGLPEPPGGGVSSPSLALDWAWKFGVRNRENHGQGAGAAGRHCCQTQRGHADAAHLRPPALWPEKNGWKHSVVHSESTFGPFGCPILVHI